MDKKTKRYILLFLLTQLTLPVCLVLGYVNHTPFIPVSKWAVSLLLVAASVTITTKLRDRQLPSWASLLSVAAFANAAALLGQGIFGGIGAIVCFWCGWTMVKCSGRGFLRGLCYVTSTLATTALILAMPLWGFVQIMGHTQVIRKEPSPDRRYTAILKSIDEGALGGDTVVEVLDHHRSVHILLGRFTASEILWRGDWGAHERMSLSWEDGDTLNINGISYTVAGEDAPLIAEISHTLGARIRGGQVLEQWDTHGGFHGDGTRFLKIQGSCTVPDSNFWHPLPASEEVARLMGWCRDDTGAAMIPEVRNGYWFFYNRHSRSSDRSLPDDFGSWNFTLAVYDAENRMVYYYELDT